MYSSNFKQLIINSKWEGRNTVCIPATKLQCLWGVEKEDRPLYIFLCVLSVFRKHLKKNSPIHTLKEYFEYYQVLQLNFRFLFAWAEQL